MLHIMNYVIRLKEKMAEELKMKDEILKCPKCGGEHLHHTKVELFNRKEDSSKGLYIESLVEEKPNEKNFSVGNSLDKLKIETILPKGNPSIRRSGISIFFFCENCDAKPRLDIAQHKGNTILNFSNTA